MAGFGCRLKHLIFVVIFSCTLLFGESMLNHRPVIGILTQKVSQEFSEYGDTYILASYVKYLEESGARAVPIRAGQSESYYEKIFSQINGVLFPGGDVDLGTSYYAHSGRYIYDLAKKANDAGDHFPLWGTCQGFQLLNNLTACENLLTPTDSENLALPLNITTENVGASRLFGKMSAYIYNILENRPVTYNHHHLSIKTDTFYNTASLKSFYRVLSTNVDRKGVEFISTFEAFKYPFYGTQWHPEKNNFEWNPKLFIDHSDLAIDVAQYFSNYFVNEARFSNHKFLNNNTEIHSMIDNYKRTYLTDGTFDVIYFFNLNGTDPFEKPLIIPL
ncbi:gamma-glutamyl hydrolase A-like [Patella vulgata]|uniref:gamma-glutamyl hydrolase A-like n=1 Tax=Patella vulgata TaxID=6465 RepID=UPI00217F5ED3|nr:gamma-glutamyl hydrolase A-like [Patella vulgata]